jgi:hypothetical protein
MSMLEIERDQDCGRTIEFWGLSAIWQAGTAVDRSQARRRKVEDYR